MVTLVILGDVASIITVKTEHLLQAKSQNVKEYWRLLKGKPDRSKPNVSNEQFYQYFKKVHCPSDDFFTPEEDVREYINNVQTGELQQLLENWMKKLVWRKL